MVCRGLVLPPALFVVLAVLLLTLLVCLGLLVVVAVTYVAVDEPPQRKFDRGWALLSGVALTWGLVNLYWSSLAAQSSRVERNSALPLPVLGHFAIAISCGLIALGIHTVSVARAFGTDPIVMDYSHANVPNGETESVAAAVVTGDAEEGRKVFSTTCITCHGPTGDGLPNLAPSLRGSSFVESADDGGIASVIRLGRAATDPANKTKKVMPARGGNPFLGDDKIAHLVAFVRKLQTEAPGAAVGSVDPNAPPPMLLAKWVVPSAGPPPAGMMLLDERADIGDMASLAARGQERKSLLVKAFTLALTGLHGLFLLGVMVASSDILLRSLREEPAARDAAQWAWSTLGWIVAALVWLIVFVLGFVAL